MRRFSFPLALLCLVPLYAACDMQTTTAPSTRAVAVSGFAGRGLWSDSMATGAPFTLIVQDSSGQRGGELIMLGDTIPPAGTYDVDNNLFPAGLSQLAVDFVQPAGNGTTKLFQPAGGKMVITSISPDSITGSLSLVMPLTGICTGDVGAITGCTGTTENTVLTLTGKFVARHTSPEAVPAP